MAPAVTPQLSIGASCPSVSLGPSWPSVIGEVRKEGPCEHSPRLDSTASPLGLGTPHFLRAVWAAIGLPARCDAHCGLPRFRSRNSSKSAGAIRIAFEMRMWRSSPRSQSA